MLEAMTKCASGAKLRGCRLEPYVALISYISCYFLDLRQVKTLNYAAYDKIIGSRKRTKPFSGLLSNDLQIMTCILKQVLINEPLKAGAVSLMCEKLYTEGQQGHRLCSESCRRSGGEHARVPMGFHYESGVQVSFGTTRAFLETSFSLQHGACPHVRVGSSYVFPAQIPSILGDLTGHLFTFSYASLLHDYTNKEVITPITTSICIDTVTQSLSKEPRQNGNVYPDHGP